VNLLELHTFWFEDIALSEAYYSRKVHQWFFSGDQQFDELCKERFSPWIFSLSLEKMSLETLSPKEYLGLILLLDQIPRNSFRGSHKAFRFDFLAQELTLRALGTAHEKKLSLPEKMFLYMPLEHAENVSLQELSVEKFAELHAKAPIEIQKWTELALHKAKEHKETIQRYGCFPKRVRAFTNAD
jgi:uncharacterized protein (DUF924 family)